MLVKPKSLEHGIGTDAEAKRYKNFHSDIDMFFQKATKKNNNKM